jgi:photosystem II stability/assembly factor-like uncharacterized protein
MRKNLALVALTALFLPALVMPGNAQRSGRTRTAPQATSERAQERAEREETDADVPSLFRGQINKRDYMQRRAEQIAMRRGQYDDPTGKMRARAIRTMERQERQLRAQSESPDVPLVDSSIAWTSIGPAPIPNGSGLGGTTPTSGRTISIAIHPTDPNIAYFGTAQGGLYRTKDGGNTYDQLMDRALSLAIGSLTLVPGDPNTLWVGTGESGFSADSFFGYGVYRIRNAASDSPTLEGPFNKDAATGLTDLMTGRSAAGIAIDPNNPDVMYVGTSSGIGGLGADVFGNAPIRGLFKSTNATSANPTFTKLAIGSITAGTDIRVMDILFAPGSSTNMIITVVVTAGTLGGVWRTTDANVAAPTFTQTLSLVSFSSGISRGEIAQNGATVYYASSENSGAATCGVNGAMRKSTDGGVTWSAPIAGGNGFCAGQCFYNIAVDVDPSNANNVMLGGNVVGACTKGISRSTDGGATFSNSPNVHADNHVVKFALSNPLIVYEGNDGGIFKSTNGGTTFTSINRTGFVATQFQSLALHPTDRHFMIGGTQDNGTEYLPPSFNWTNADGGDGGFALIDQGAADTENVNMYHTYFNQSGTVIGFARMIKASCIPTKDWVGRGACGFGPPDPTLACDGTPRNLLNGLTCSDAVEFYAPMALGPGTPNTVYYGTNRLNRSADRGDTMLPVSQATGSTLTAIGISRMNDNIRLIGTRAGTVFLTTTGGNPMTNVTGAITAKYVARAVIDPNSTTTAYITLAGFGTIATPVQHVWKTTGLSEAGTTWTAASTGLPDTPVNAFVVDPSNSMHLYAGTDIGIYRSTDAGGSWAPFGTGFPRVAVFDMAIQSNNRVLRVATHGRGIWEIKLNPVAARVADFNGDGRTDLAVQRPNDSWYILNSTLSITDAAPAPTIVTFEGVLSDQLTPGDYDGDGKTDFAVFRSADNSWRIRFSGGGADSNTVFGASGDKPVQADYDGDGKTDLAVYRQNSPVAGQATFFVRQSSDLSLLTVQWGLTSDKAVAGDYDGDGKADFAVWRPGSGVWYVLKSTCAYGCFDGAQWGLSGDQLVPADYDGDGKFDRAVFRPGNGTWYVLKSGDGAVRSVQWGLSTDTPVPGDYDGDGMTDFAVWRGSAGDWFVLKSSNQPVRGVHWGSTGDRPPAAKYIPEQMTP